MPPPTRPPYPAQFRAETIRLVRESGKAMSQIAKNLGVATESLRRWVRQAEIDSGEREGLTTAEREELRLLRRDVRILREEREILEKPRPSLPRTNISTTADTYAHALRSVDQDTAAKTDRILASSRQEAK